MSLAALHLQLTPVLAAEKSKVPFYILGGCLVLWAVTLALGLGMRNPNFPGSLRGQRIVVAVSALLVAGTLATAVITAGPPSGHAKVTKDTLVSLGGAPVPTKPAFVAGTQTVVSASTSTSTSAAAPSSVKVSTATLPKVGAVLVNAEGHTLYIYVPDNHAKVTCVSACALVWPPLKLASGQKAVAAGQAKAALLGSDADPEGGSVVTYAGWPLYSYVADSAAGTDNGQGINANGGLWYVISPAGTVIRVAP